MVEVTREERVGHLIESFYRATAETFSLDYGKASTVTFRNKKQAKELATIVLDALKKLGFNLEYNERTLAKVAEIRAKIEDCCESGEFEDQVSAMEDLDLLTRSLILDFAQNSFQFGCRV